MAKKKAKNGQVEVGLRVIWGVILAALALFVGLGLVSYDWHDISRLHAPPNDPPTNLIGPFGAWLSYILFEFAGMGAYLAPVALLVVAAVFIIDKAPRVWPRVVWCLLLVLAVIILLELRADFWLARCEALNISYPATGIVGTLLTRAVLVNAIGPVGTALLWGTIGIVSFVLLVKPHNLARTYEVAGDHGASFLVRMRQYFERKREIREQRRLAAAEKKADKERQRLEEEVEAIRQRELEQQQEPQPPPDPVPPPPEPVRPKKASRVTRKQDDDEYPDPDVPYSSGQPYQLPPLSLLNAPPGAGPAGSRADIELTSRLLTETLREFRIDVEVTHADRGPVVTRYELLPAPGIKVERIANLANNLALSLKAHSVRVQAPIPGKGVVGVEVPNSSARLVVSREIMESTAWSRSKHNLPLCLGKDVSGAPVVTDLARIPHLLIAGATGTGKSVCMNSILIGLLMSRTPDQLRLMLVDPKIVEFSPYNELPHLVVPVITDPKKVALGLRWAIKEMTRRFEMFAKVGARDIEGFNKRNKNRRPTAGSDQPELFDGKGHHHDETLPDTLPYIMIVIDELADLMLVDQSEIENCIARLAQLSRAVGIHMIVATQRPSVNVITGTIKANFPGRIAFKVAQKVDSRTIIDGMGAETLLGRGDMLFVPPGSSKIQRVQGALMTDDEVKNVVAFIKKQASAPSYEMEIKETLDKPTDSVAAGGGDGDDEDRELIEKSIAVIRETRRASTSSLQRRLRIGYTRAARIMDKLEEMGVIGPPRGSDPREILIDLDAGIPDTADSDDDGDETQEQP